MSLLLAHKLFILLRISVLAILEARVTKSSPVGGLGTAGHSHGDNHGAEDPGAGRPLGQEEGRHLAPLRGHAAVGEGVPRHQIYAGLRQFLVKCQQSLFLIWSTVSVDDGSTWQS